MSDVPPIPNSNNPFGAPQFTPPISDLPDKDACTWAMLCHLASLLGLGSIPLANLLGPLVVWLIKKDSHPFVDDQGKESLNFQITMVILLFVAGLTFCLAGVGIVFYPLVALYGIVMPIIAAVKSNKGERYRYPATLRLIT
jgi:uncharacterized Tic20 family protein